MRRDWRDAAAVTLAITVMVCVAGCTSAAPAASIQSPGGSASASADPAAQRPATDPVIQTTVSTATPEVTPPTQTAATSTTASQSTANTATSALRPPPTTPVAPPVRGNVHQTVPAATPVTLQAAALTEKARPNKGVTVQVTDIRPVSTEARFPGEVAGPGIAVTLNIDNSGSSPIDLDNAIVDVRGSDGSRAVQVSGSPASPMSGSLLPGHEMSGTYVFTIPRDQRHPISIRFSYAAKTPIVLFVGDTE